MMYKGSATVLIALLTLANCNKTNENVDVLARVGSAVLTKNEVINRFPEYRTADVENQVTQWVNAELLYVAGVRAGVNKDVAIVARVEDYQKKLIGQTYLEMVLRSRVGVSTDEIKDFRRAPQSTTRGPRPLDWPPAGRRISWAGGVGTRTTIRSARRRSGSRWR